MYTAVISVHDQNFETVIEDFEGELMKLNTEYNQYYHWKAGMQVQCTLDDTAFETKILKVEGHSIYVYVPYSVNSNLQELRRAPRIPTAIPAVIMMNEMKFQQVNGTIINVSSTGVRLKTDFPIQYSIIYISFAIQSETIQLKTEITNQEQVDGQHHFGCRITEITKNHSLLLQRYILIEQLKKASSS